jgi:hypothetical protein
MVTQDRDSRQRERGGAVERDCDPQPIDPRIGIARGAA